MSNSTTPPSPLEGFVNSGATGGAYFAGAAAGLPVGFSAFGPAPQHPAMLDAYGMLMAPPGGGGGAMPISNVRFY